MVRTQSPARALLRSPKHAPLEMRRPRIACLRADLTFRSAYASAPDRTQTGGRRDATSDRSGESDRGRLLSPWFAHKQLLSMWEADSSDPSAERGKARVDAKSN